MINLRERNLKKLKENHIYQDNMEHDACGVGLVVSTEGKKSRKVVKAGIEAFSRSLASEVGTRGITVNAVAPGFIKTDMTESNKGVSEEELIKQIPLGRFGESTEIAHLVNFLCSEESSYITGQTIHINGGLFM